MADHCRAARKSLRYYQRHERKWRERMGVGPQRAIRAPALREMPWNRIPARPPAPATSPSLWRAKARAARKAYERYRAERLALFRRLYEKWRCIHEHEAAWNDPNDPYHGGFSSLAGSSSTTAPSSTAAGGTPLARLGATHHRRAWLQRQRFPSLAQHRPYVRVAVKPGRGRSRLRNDSTTSSNAGMTVGSGWATACLKATAGLGMAAAASCSPTALPTASSGWPNSRGLGSSSPLP